MELYQKGAACLRAAAWRPGILVFTIIAAAGRTTAYAQYDHDLKKEPELSLVFKGLHDGVTPADALLRRQHTSASSKDVEAILGRQNTEEPAAAATEQEVASAAREESQEGGKASHRRQRPQRRRRMTPRTRLPILQFRTVSTIR